MQRVYVVILKNIIRAYFGRSEEAPMKAKKPTRIKVLIVDGHPCVRAGVRTFLAKHSVAVVGEAADGAEALRKVKRLSPHVIVTDGDLRSIDGGELARRLRQAAPSAKIIAFSIHAGVDYIVRMARCGAHGYVTKDKPTADLLCAIREVLQGGLYFPPEAADSLLLQEPALAQGGPLLTEREVEVLKLLATGLANKEVARKLAISVRTAESHRQHLARKLSISSVAGLTKYALRQGLTLLQIPDPSSSFVCP
jgi:DNA-binding NarL/FixJ family response regulator